MPDRVFWGGGQALPVAEEPEMRMRYSWISYHGERLGGKQGGGGGRGGGGGGGGEGGL